MKNLWIEILRLCSTNQSSKKIDPRRHDIQQQFQPVHYNFLFSNRADKPLFQLENLVTFLCIFAQICLVQFNYFFSFFTPRPRLTFF